MMYYGPVSVCCRLIFIVKKQVSMPFFSVFLKNPNGHFQSFLEHQKIIYHLLYKKILEFLKIQSLEYIPQFDKLY